MKIFNWMHRKLHPNISYAQVSQKKGALAGESEKKEEMARQREGERDTEALLLHDVLDGILTIGTLGNGHPLFSQSYSPQEESLQKEQEKELEEEDKDEDEEEQAVLAVAAFVVEEYKPVAVVESSKVKLALGEEDKKTVQMVVVEEEEEAEKLLEEPLLKDTEKREKGRTTLADLFAADASMGEVTSKKLQATNPATRSQTPCRKTSTQHKKKGKSSPQSNTTSTKLHRLITRMLKKKIHPELNERSTDEVSLMAGRAEDISSHSEVV